MEVQVKMRLTNSSTIFIVLSYLIYSVVLLLLPSLTNGSIILNEPKIEGVQRDGEEVDIIKNSPSLLELYDNLTSIFDFESIQHFVQRKNETDPEARALLMAMNNYLRGPKAKRLVDVLWNDTEFVDLIDYVHKHGLTDIYEKINKIHEIFGYDPVYPPSQKFLDKEIITYESSIEKPKIFEITLLLDQPQEKVRKNINNNNDHTLSIHKLKIRDQMNRNIIREEPATASRLIQEFLDFLPLEQVRKFMSYASTTPSFLSLHSKASQPRFAQHYRDFKKQPEIAELETIIKGAGLEFDSLRKIIEMLMKWENHTSVGLFDTQ